MDRAAVRSIRELPWVVEDDAPHRDKHGLEVHLPFFQLVLGTLTVVPLVVGEAAAGEVAGVLARLWGGDETLVVISSDLSHYLGHGLPGAAMPRRQPQSRHSTAAGSDHRTRADAGRSPACSPRRRGAALWYDGSTCETRATRQGRRTACSVMVPGCSGKGRSEGRRHLG